MRQPLLVTSLALLLLGHAAHAETQTLEDALAIAYAHNPALLAERAKLRATDEHVSQALGGWRPNIEATGGIGRSQQKIVNMGSDSLTPRGAGVQVSQPLFRGFRTESAVDAAEAEVRAGRAMLENAEQELLFSAAKAYLDVLSSRRVLDLTRNNEEVLRSQLDATNNRFKIGEVTKTDIAQSESRLSAASAGRIKAEGDLARDVATFVRVVGENPAALQQPSLVLERPASLEETVRLSEKNHPAVIAATFAEDAAKAATTLAKGNLLPEVSLVGSVSRGWEQSVMIPTRQDDATVMVRVTIPLYRAGTDYSKTREARETATQRRLELEDIRNRARELAIQSWQNLQTARAQIQAQKSQAAAATLALHGVREELKAGTRTTLDALDAEQELLNAKVALVKAEHDEALSILQVRAAIGNLTSGSMDLKVEAYNPREHYDQVRNQWIGTE